MQRAIQTGEAIASAVQLSAPDQVRGLTVEAFDGLLDIDFGEWQGHSPDEVGEHYPDLLRAWLEAPHTVQMPGGENLNDVRSRVVAGLDKLIERHLGQTVALVGHAVVNRVLLCAVLGLGNEHFWRLRQDTCAVNVFDADGDGTFTIVLLNDTCHLRDING
jgi:probable phosphoglycerate mutase